jgi:hypothetical protein
MISRIFEQVLKKDKKGNIISKFAIMQNLDPSQLNIYLAKYCSNVPCNFFVDIKLNDPWTRVIISGIDKLPFLNESQKIRYDKLKKINNE